MQKIYKYTLRITDIQKVEMPMNNTVLSAKEQNGNLCLWVLVDINQKTELNYEIEIFGTGNPFEGGTGVMREFIDTVVMSNGLVWHLFKRIV